MGKYIGSLCRLCRAESAKLFLKGRRCLSDKCSIERRNYPPGMKGAKVSFRKSNYKNQLREKQKVKRFYGVGEKQFRNFFQKSAQKKGITGENLLRFLELRLDNIVYRLNFAYSRSHARQLVRHGHVTVNGRKVNIPSYITKLNDEIAFCEKSMKNESIKTMLEDVRGLVETPAWLVVDSDKVVGRINAIPNREDILLPIEEHLIVELYSK